MAYYLTFTTKIYRSKKGKLYWEIAKFIFNHGFEKTSLINFFVCENLIFKSYQSGIFKNNKFKALGKRNQSFFDFANFYRSILYREN